MAVSIEQFGKAIVASGLQTADDVKSLWNGLSAADRPKDGSGFAQLLVDRGKLTAFQAKELIDGRGDRLIMGDYVVLAEIGAGGMGQVYKARHRTMERIVALKVMSAAAMKDEAAVKRFQREVRAAARLEHSNIVTAYDSGEAGTVKYLVMQFVDGGDLSALVKKNGPLPIGQAVDYVVQAAKGLAFAHGEGVIHRDIKPANLLLDRKGTVKILDMGLARIESGDDGLTATEQVMGTVDYMSPEQAAQTKGVDARADIYSLGCTLWYLLTGKKLYDAETMIARLMAHRDGELPSLVKARDDASWPLEQAFHKMIAKRPEDRFQSMDEVVAALAPFGPSGSSVGMGSSIGMGSGPQDAELASFLKTVGPGTKPQTKPAPSATNVGTEATAQFVSAEVSTDPKSEILPAPRSTAKPQPKSGPSKGKKPPIALIAGGIGGLALLMALGVWVIIKNKDGSEVARVQVPEGGSVTVQDDGTARPAPAASPTATSAPSSFFTPAVPSSPNTAPSFIAPTVSPGVQNLPAGKWGLKFEPGQYVETVPAPYRKTTVVTVETWFTDECDPTIVLIGVVKCDNGRIGISSNMLTMYTHHTGNPEGIPAVRNRRIHVAAVNDGKARRMYLDGKLVAQSNDPGSISSPAIGKSSRMMIGDQQRFRGVIDAVRISSTARYDKDFTPPTSYTSDQDTFALYLFDEGQGDVLKDSSGNNYHGKITGATWVRGSTNPAADGVVYLDDLMETGFHTAGPLGKHGQDRTKRPLNLENGPPQHSLAMHTHSDLTAWATYDLAAKYTEFLATMRITGATPSPHTFRVLGDGKTLWEFLRPIGQVDPKDLVVDVRGVRELKLEVQCAGSTANSQAIWIDPRLTPISAAAPNSDGDTPAAKTTESVPRWPLAPSKPEDIQWLHDEMKAFVTIRVGSGPDVRLKSTDPLPAGSATIVGIEAYRDGRPQMTDAALARIATLADLEMLQCDLGVPGAAATKVGMAEIAKLTELRYLNLGRMGTADTDYSFLERLPHLERLRLAIVPFPNWIDPVRRLSNLRELTLHQMDLTRFSELKNCRGLETVILSGDIEKCRQAIQAQALLTPWIRFELRFSGGLPLEVTEPTAPPPNAGAAAAPANPNLADPAFQAWLQATAALGPDDQVKAVVDELKRRNPEFTGVESHAIENGAVAMFELDGIGVTDIAPLRAFAKLRDLSLRHRSRPNDFNGKIADLSPLQGLPLQSLNASGTAVSDLSPLRGMPLTTLSLRQTQVTDLEPLRGFKSLTSLDLHRTESTPYQDLSPLADLPQLENLTLKNHDEPDVAAFLRTLPALKKLSGKPVDEALPKASSTPPSASATGTK